jgi:hypothetical protein
MTLDNLLKIHQLQLEAPDKREFEGLRRAALDRLIGDRTFRCTRCAILYGKDSRIGFYFEHRRQWIMR